MLNNAQTVDLIPERIRTRSKAPVTPEADKIWSNRLSTIKLSLVGMQSDTGRLDDSLAVSYKAKQTLAIQRHNCTP